MRSQFLFGTTFARSRPVLFWDDFWPRPGRGRSVSGPYEGIAPYRVLFTGPYEGFATYASRVSQSQPVAWQRESRKETGQKSSRKKTGQARGASRKKTGGGAEQGPDGAGSPEKELGSP